MAREHLIEPLDEREQRTIDAFERDLSALLAVEPSPEFLARVRQRIETSAAAGRNRLWMWAAVAALLIIAVGIATLIRSQPSGEAPVIARSEPAPHPPERVPTATTARRGEARPEATSLPSRRLRRARPDAARFEVVVDRAQADAVRRLLAEAGRAPRNATLELPVEPAGSQVTEISVPPVVVSPLDVPDINATNKGVEW